MTSTLISAEGPRDAPGDKLISGPDVKELRPHNGLQLIDLRELWRYRDLLWFFALRDIQVRYKQSVLGILWAVLQPMAMMVVLEFILTHFFHQPSNPVSRYAKLLPWMFFASAVIASTNSLVANADLLRKIYFPRIAVPIAAVGAPLVDFAIAFFVLIGLMVFFQVEITWRLALMPLLTASTILAALGVGILMAGLSIAYRDFRYVVPFLVSIGFFVSGVMVDVDHVPWPMHLNPMSGVIGAFGSAVTGQPIDWGAWGISTLSATVFLALGLTYFSRTQRSFADIV